MATNNTGMYLTSVERQSVREGDSMTVQSLRQKTGHAAWHTFRPSFSAKSWRKVCPRSCNINAVIYNLHANSQCSRGGSSSLLLSLSLHLLLPCPTAACTFIVPLLFVACPTARLLVSCPFRRGKEKIFRRQRLIARAWLGLVPSKYI